MQAGSRADHVDQRVGYRTSEDVGNARKGFQQARNLRTANHLRSFYGGLRSGKLAGNGAQVKRRKTSANYT